MLYFCLTKLKLNISGDCGQLMNRKITAFPAGLVCFVCMCFAQILASGRLLFFNSLQLEGITQEKEEGWNYCIGKSMLTECNLLQASMPQKGMTDSGKLGTVFEWLGRRLRQPLMKRGLKRRENRPSIIYLLAVLLCFERISGL